MGFCEGCFQKQRKIDELTEEISRLKAKLRYLKRKEQEGYFGSSTPSSKVPIKADAVKQNRHRRGGAKPGHPGHGRAGFDPSQADCITRVASEVGDRCPHCGDPLEDKGIETRSVMDMPALKAKRILYLLSKKYCRSCRRSFKPSPPGVLPKSLYGNQLIGTAASMHYLHGIPMGRICHQLDIGIGPLVEIFHRLAKMFGTVPHRLVQEYRQSPVKHADETSWRTNGQSGYVWLFATNKISIFLFRTTRSASVPREVFGEKPLAGTLVVDRYNAYNKAPCTIQYCYAHLLRDVQDVDKEFSDEQEVKNFVATLAPLMAAAMGLRSLPIADSEFYMRANEIKSHILEVVDAPARHLAIRRIQEIFHENEDRLYHWVTDRQIPADNNLAERDLRPSVIARKVSFGSQSDAGAQTRSILMTVLHTLKKRCADPCAALKTSLDRIAQDPTVDPFELLFPPDTQPLHPP